MRSDECIVHLVLCCQCSPAAETNRKRIAERQWAKHLRAQVRLTCLCERRTAVNAQLSLADPFISSHHRSAENDSAPGGGQWRKEGGTVMLTARSHRPRINTNTADMQRDEPLDGDVNNTLLHKHSGQTPSIASSISNLLQRYITPLRCLAIAIAVLLLLLVRHFNAPSTPPAFPLSVACCAHTSYHPRLQIVTVGDSITEYGSRQGGWVSLLSGHYVRHADVYNRGYSGYNTRTYLALLHQHLSLGLWPYQPQHNDGDSRGWTRLVTLYLGTNDATLPVSATNETRLHTPLDEFSANLRSLVALLVPPYSAYVSNSTAAPSHYLSTQTALVLITPAQSNLTAWQLRKLTPPYPPISSLPVTRTLDNTAQYAAAVRALADEWHIPCLDMWPLTAPSNWQRLFSDGLHLSPAGNRVLYDELMRLVRDSYGELDVRVVGEEAEEEAVRLDLDAPLFHDIDYNDIAGSFAIRPAAR